MTNKPRVIKDYDKLSEELIEQLKLVYPLGFRGHLVEFKGLDGNRRKGLPFETEDKYYLIRMTEEKAVYIISEDDDYDIDGKLKTSIKDELAEKYEDEDFLDELNSNADNDLGSDEELDDDF
jgi:hypothetical protein